MRAYPTAALFTAALLTPGMAAAQTAAGDWLVRVRGIVVSPTESSGEVSGLPGSRVGVTDSVMPEVDFTYMATDHIGAELIVATTKHKATGRGSIAAIDTVASTWVLPPTLTLQYHLAPTGKIRPYVGAGVNYTVFYAENASDALEGALGSTKVRMSDSAGYALQAGVDVDIGPRTFLNVDVKYIDIDTTARLTTAAGTNRVRVSIDPLVIGVGVGMRF
ncbi:OmpW/AlkL family protein [Sphingomonas panni]|uniref:OmpW/AlkL family protein n=1 Tax=Sphingomonas panni TaxID=237612 RepID=UPI002414535C|nr:OmpW family outer membrane protein [Sphingomonas panni]